MQTELLKVTGMTCNGCASKVMKVLKEVNGVSNVDVSLAAGEATVKFDQSLTSPVQLKSTIESAGYGVDEDNATLSHKNKGGCCS
jgi:copper chaperone CopZ